MAGQQISGVKEVLKELKELENGAINALRKDIRKYLADDVAAAYRYVQESEYQMVFGVRNAGMFHKGRTGFSTPQVKIGIRPRAKHGIVSFVAESPNKTAGYEILEKAGSRSGGVTSQGRALIGMLRRHFPPNKAGRFVFAAVQARLPLITKDVAFIIEQYADQVSSRLSSGADLKFIGRAGDIL